MTPNYIKRQLAIMAKDIINLEKSVENIKTTLLFLLGYCEGDKIVNAQSQSNSVQSEILLGAPNTITTHGNDFGNQQPTKYSEENKRG